MASAHDDAVAPLVSAAPAVPRTASQEVVGTPRCEPAHASALHEIARRRPPSTASARASIVNAHTAPVLQSASRRASPAATADASADASASAAAGPPDANASRRDRDAARRMAAAAARRGTGAPTASPLATAQVLTSVVPARLAVAHHAQASAATETAGDAAGAGAAEVQPPVRQRRAVSLGRGDTARASSSASPRLVRREVRIRQGAFSMLAAAEAAPARGNENEVAANAAAVRPRLVSAGGAVYGGLAASGAGGVAAVAAAVIAAPARARGGPGFVVRVQRPLPNTSTATAAAPRARASASPRAHTPPVVAPRKRTPPNYPPPFRVGAVAALPTFDEFARHDSSGGGGGARARSSESGDDSGGRASRRDRRRIRGGPSYLDIAPPVSPTPREVATQHLFRSRLQPPGSLTHHHEHPQRGGDRDHSDATAPIPASAGRVAQVSVVSGDTASDAQLAHELVSVEAELRTLQDQLRARYGLALQRRRDLAASQKHDESSRLRLHPAQWPASTASTSTAEVHASPSRGADGAAVLRVRAGGVDARFTTHEAPARVTVAATSTRALAATPTSSARAPVAVTRRAPVTRDAAQQTSDAVLVATAAPRATPRPADPHTPAPLAAPQQLQRASTYVDANSVGAPRAPLTALLTVSPPMSSGRVGPRSTPQHRGQPRWTANDLHRTTTPPPPFGTAPRSAALQQRHQPARAAPREASPVPAHDEQVARIPMFADHVADRVARLWAERGGDSAAFGSVAQQRSRDARVTRRGAGGTPTTEAARWVLEQQEQQRLRRGRRAGANGGERGDERSDNDDHDDDARAMLSRLVARPLRPGYERRVATPPPTVQRESGEGAAHEADGATARAAAQARARIAAPRGPPVDGRPTMLVTPVKTALRAPRDRNEAFFANANRDVVLDSRSRGGGGGASAFPPNPAAWSFDPRRYGNDDDDDDSAPPVPTPVPPRPATPPPPMPKRQLEPQYALPVPSTNVVAPSPHWSASPAHWSPSPSPGGALHARSQGHDVPPVVDVAALVAQLSTSRARDAPVPTADREARATDSPTPRPPEAALTSAAERTDENDALGGGGGDESRGTSALSQGAAATVNINDLIAAAAKELGEPVAAFESPGVAFDDGGDGAVAIQRAEVALVAVPQHPQNPAHPRVTVEELLPDNEASFEGARRQRPNDGGLDANALQSVAANHPPPTATERVLAFDDGIV
jgi:hypothetical protein